jgi:hypothetical protein
MWHKSVWYVEFQFFVVFFSNILYDGYIVASTVLKVMLSRKLWSQHHCTTCKNVNVIFKKYKTYKKQMVIKKNNKKLEFYISNTFMSHMVWFGLWCLSTWRKRGLRGHDRMVVESTTTCAISAYHHKSCEFETHSWPDVVDTILCVKVCQWLATCRCFSYGTNSSIW